jgi:hypothetical protein
MVEKNSGVPPLSEVAAPLQQTEPVETVPDGGIATSHQAKRTRKPKSKQDAESDPVPNKDPVNAEQSNIPAVAAGSDTPTVAVTVAAPVESAGPVVKEAVEDKVVVPDQKRKYKRSRPLPPIEHKRVVHYYRQAKPIKRKDRRNGDKDRRDDSGSRNRDDGHDKKYRYDDDDDDDDDYDDELLSESDWNVDSDDESDPSDNDSDDDERVTKHVKKHEPDQGTRRDDGGRFAPIHAVMQYRIV